MAAGALSKDDLTEMMLLLDSDGDDNVSEDEFRAFCESTMGIEDGAFNSMWKKIDSNGDGNLQFAELCEYFGVSVDEANAGAEARKNMSDDDIMEALQLQTKLQEERDRILKAEKEKKTKALTRRTASGLRAGVTIIKQTDTSDEQKLLEKSEMVEAGDKKIVWDLLGWQKPESSGENGNWKPLPISVNVRIESLDKAEMPLHKLARNHDHKCIDRIYNVVKDKDGQDAAKADINSQNKDGKTAIFAAVEGRLDELKKIESDSAKLTAYREAQNRTVSVLLGHGADLYVEAGNGWNTLHAAAHGNAFEAAKGIFEHMDKNQFTVLQRYLLVNHTDKDGRTPLHIAAMRADPNLKEPPFVKLLLNKGADPKIRDAGSKLTPGRLAEKAGRRNSKELIESSEKEQDGHRVNYRRKSVSKEIPQMDLKASET